MIGGLVADDFRAFFQDVWSYPPFQWQDDLCRQVLADGTWPSVIDLPTGSGKTAALDVALFCLAAQPEVFPRRIIFVIDRRVIVDQVARRAEHLGNALAQATGGVLKRVADALNALSDAQDALSLGTLRGGSRELNDWAKWPDQPAVIVSTVDQFGSRLLFRGYGVSEGMLPVHAGLAGNDCLVILDEVHLAEPLRQTLEAIELLRPAAQLPRRWQVVEMSATPAKADTKIFRLDPERHVEGEHNAELRRRVTARKEATLAEMGKKNEKPATVLAREIPAMVKRIRATLGESAVIGVVVNRVASARAVAAAISSTGETTRLVTGRMRPIERDVTMEEVEKAADPDRGDGQGMVVVATQCIEVGADLSFDALITEVAPLDSLRQRFGRLDRRGLAADRGEPSQAIIVGALSAVSDTDDPVYGSKLANTWAALNAAFDSNGFDPPVFDVGPRSADLAGLSSDLAANKTDAPLLLPGHLDALVQTSPRPLAQPTVAHFLHGLTETETDVSVVWRADLGQLAGFEGEVRTNLSACPPAAGEMMPVPIAAAKRWLSNQPEAEVSDVEGTRVAPEERPNYQVNPDPRAFAIWRGADGIVVPASVREVRPGDVIVVPSSYGGVQQSAGDGNWDPTSNLPVEDYGSESQALAGRSVVVRFLPIADAHADTDEYVERSVDEIVDDWLADNQSVPGVAEVEGTHRAGRSIETIPIWNGTAYAEGFLIRAAKTQDFGRFLDGSDGSNSFTGQRITLISHLEGVGKIAAQFAQNCGLSAAFIEDFGLAGRLHDLGKADPRFQRLLNGGDLASALETEMLAKSPLRSSPLQRRINKKLSEYPVGMRHELLSLAMIDQVEELRSKAIDWDLVLHLVTTHHGYCRPLPPVVNDAAPLSIAFDAEGLSLSAFTAKAATPGMEVAERFWLLVRKYGWHGLAWLETIFRLADHRRSELETQA